MLKSFFLYVLFAVLFMSGCGDPGLSREDRGGLNLLKSAVYLRGDLTFGYDSQPLLKGRPLKESDWQPYNYKRAAFNRHGRFVLWIKIVLPDEAVSEKVLFIPAGSYGCLFEAYIGKIRIYKPPKFLKQEKTAIYQQPLVISLPETRGGYPVYLKFETDQPGHVGFVSPVYYTSEARLLKNIINRQADRLILGFIFIFSGLVSLLIFFKNFRGKPFGVLAFSIMSISVGMLAIFASDLVLLFYITPRFPYYVTLLALIFFPVGIFLFIDETIGPGYKNLIRWSWKIFLALSFIALLFMIAGIHLQMFYIVVLRIVIMFVSLAAAVAELIRAVMRRSINARLTSIGLLIFGFAALMDEAVFHGFADSSRLAAPWGYFIMMNLLGFILYRIFEKSQDKLKAYSAELEDKSQILQDLNRNLEERVEERTRELSEANTLLHDTNKILGDRNRVIENEIVMARRIQQQLIPVHDIAKNICSVYKPMELVGGDFFDYIDLGESRTGIFISDVSGHGIPAALITSMVKTIILQSPAVRDDPAQLIRQLNHVLYGKTADNFITAFYCIIDFSAGSMIYCNAGHNNPLIIKGRDITEVKGARSLPIGAMNNDFLDSMNKGYVNSLEPLPAGGLLLLYTDGLTEAVSINGGAMFEDTMTETILSIKAGGAHTLVHGLYDSLKKFRGGDTFEDDVCLIGVEC
jgi:serine phosphatase RsbU (regulator of sigma subunit)